MRKPISRDRKLAHKIEEIECECGYGILKLQGCSKPFAICQNCKARICLKCCKPQRLCLSNTSTMALNFNPQQQVHGEMGEDFRLIEEKEQESINSSPQQDDEQQLLENEQEALYETYSNYDSIVEFFSSAILSPKTLINRYSFFCDRLL